MKNSALRRSRSASAPLVRALRHGFAVLFIGLCLTLPALANQPLRIVTWNIETVGEPGEPQYAAAIAVLNRLDADLVALQEVNGYADVGYASDLAADLGYAHAVISPQGEYDGLRTALFSDYPILASDAWTSVVLSGDALANDLTRVPFEVTVDLPGDAPNLRLILSHLKSGSGNDDEFRRAIESYRLTQITDTFSTDAPFIILGDLNADRGDDPLTPSYFTELPSGLPQSFETGLDIDAKLLTTGLLNDPFTWLGTVSRVLPALQLDGTDATRPESGRALDYLLLSPEIDLSLAQTQIYDCEDEGLPGSLPLVGLPLATETCDIAADHLPVFADLVVGSTPSTLVTTGDCLLDWAEDSFPGVFLPRDTLTQYEAPEHYRYYRDTNAYLRVSEIDQHVIFVNPLGASRDVGPMAGWLPAAACSPPPTQCLFDWAEQRVPGLFPPGTAPTVVGFIDTYREYPQTGAYLALSSRDNHIWYRGNGGLIDTGRYEDWMGVSGCAQDRFHELSVSITGDGKGTVVSSPTGILCDGDCSEPYAPGTVVTLTAQQMAGSSFAGWSGDGCTGSTPDCTLSMDAAKTITGTFTAHRHSITVEISPPGAGSVPCDPNPARHGEASYCLVNPATGYQLSAIGGCGGSLAGNRYTTGALTTHCTISASFTAIPVPIDGRCGVANGSTRDTAPRYFLCDAGEPSDVTGSGPWYWTCEGAHGGTDASCIAFAKTYSTIICNDGTRSPTCYTCRQGCCSHHGGCR